MSENMVAALVLLAFALAGLIPVLNPEPGDSYLKEFA